jgi:hypothetical protein
MILCFALFVAVFIRVRDWERMESLTDFHARSQQLADSLKADLDEQALFEPRSANPYPASQFVSAYRAAKCGPPPTGRHFIL